VELPEDPAIHRLDNSGAIALAGEAFLRLIERR
jgi:ribose 1,5-bisphosphokinase PhnN